MGLLKLSAAICAGAAISAGAAVLTLPAAPLAAATPAELDTLVSASAQPASGIALARKQIRAGNMLDALATLERVMINNPRSSEARLLHASVLCRIDDRRGASVELDTLRGRTISQALWAEVDAACANRGGR